MKVKVIHAQEGCKSAGRQHAAVNMQPIPGKWTYSTLYS